MRELERRELERSIRQDVSHSGGGPGGLHQGFPGPACSPACLRGGRVERMQDSVWVDV